MTSDFPYDGAQRTEENMRRSAEKVACRSGYCTGILHTVVPDLFIGETDIIPATSQQSLSSCCIHEDGENGR